MSNVVYLKTSETFIYTDFKAYNNDNLTMISVYDGYNCECKTFDNLEAYQFSFNYDLERTHEACDKSEFDQALNKFEATLKEIKEQL